MKHTYRIELMKGSNSLCETLAILAAKSNGDDGISISIADLIGVAKADLIRYPTSNENTTIEQIGENTLHIDRKIGDTYITVLAITLVEVWDSPKTTEEIDEESVILQRQILN